MQIFSWQWCHLAACSSSWGHARIRVIFCLSEAHVYQGKLPLRLIIMMTKFTFLRPKFTPIQKLHSDRSLQKPSWHCAMVGLCVLDRPWTEDSPWPLSSIPPRLLIPFSVLAGTHWWVARYWFWTAFTRTNLDFIIKEWDATDPQNEYPIVICNERSQNVLARQVPAFWLCW